MRRKPPREDLPARYRTPRAPAGPRPTLRQLRKDEPWVWVHCTNTLCLHYAPMAYVPLMIRWGLDASSDKLRACARCSKCGRKGATLTTPSWINSDTRTAPFPIR